VQVLIGCRRPPTDDERRKAAKCRRNYRSRGHRDRQVLQSNINTNQIHIMSRINNYITAIRLLASTKYALQAQLNNRRSKYTGYRFAIMVNQHVYRVRRPSTP